MNKKQVIRLTESDLHRIIKESAKQILSEDIHPDDREKENFFSWRNKEEADKRDRRDTNAYQNLSKEDRNGYFDDSKDLAAKKRNTDAKRHWDFGYRRAASDMKSDFADKAWDLDFMNNDRHEGARNYVKGGRMERWPIVSNESINKVLKENAVYNSDELYEEIMGHLQTAYDLCKEYRQNVRGSQQELNWAMKTLNTIGHMLSGHV